VGLCPPLAVRLISVMGEQFLYKVEARAIAQVTWSFVPATVALALAGTLVFVPGPMAGTPFLRLQVEWNHSSHQHRKRNPEISMPVPARLQRRLRER
jgi:hypothetical protein